MAYRNGYFFEYMYYFFNKEVHLPYYINDLIDEETNLINGKNWCIIEPLKIKGVKVTKENNKEVIKYFVTECSNESDYNKEWDFKEHKPIND